MQTIYYNGAIITMKKEGDTAEAVLTENGSILDVGKQHEIFEKAKPDTRRYDLQGKTMLPAFLDSHSHISALAQNLAKADLSRAERFEDIIQILRVFREKNNLVHGEYIQGFGYDQNRLKEQKHPTKEVLDQVSKDNPIFITHVSCHMGVANSLALKQAGMDEKIDLPEELVGRGEDGSGLNGYVAEMGMVQIYDQLSKIKLDMQPLMQEAQQIYLKNGICTIQDGAVGKEQFDSLVQLAEDDIFQIDVAAYLMAPDGADEVIKRHKEMVGQYKNHLKIGGYKLVLDGSPQGKTAWFSEPYTDGSNGKAWMGSDEVIYYAKEAIDSNLQLLAHCNGDAASQQLLESYLTAFELSDNPQKRELRPVMIHSQTVRKDQLKAFKYVGMIPSFFVDHVYYWGDVHWRNLGAERAENISPVGWANELDLRYTFHQDTPVLQPNMLRTIQSATERCTMGGRKLGEAQKISVYQALEAVTVHAAYQYFEETIKGSIEIGKRADFVVLDANPLKKEVEQISDIQVEATICQDQILYDKGNKYI